MSRNRPHLPEVPPELRRSVSLGPLATMVDTLYNWGRQRSLWPLSAGLACCAFEMIAGAAARFDFGRFGMELLRGSPRQADLMIVSGTLTKKMAPQIVRLYNQMAEPKYVMAMGACAISGGPFKEGYNVVSGVDKFLPVDVYVPGCPPRPEALIHGFLSLMARIKEEHWRDLRWYQDDGDTGIPVPCLGPDLVDRRMLNNGCFETPTDTEET